MYQVNSGNKRESRFSIRPFVLGISVGVLSCILFIYFNQMLTSPTQHVASSVIVDDTQNTEPLYWVAPMDPDFRRDKPGKSPMGMDLVPVYEVENQSVDEGPGTVFITPQVINNIGVRTARVERQSVNQSVTGLGFVQYNQDNLVHIHPRSKGWIEELFIKSTGDKVQKGQPLYSLYSTALINAQEEYLLTLASQEQRLVAAAERKLRTFHVSDRIIDELKRTRKIQERITFYSPQSGVVENLNIREGYYVEPGKTLFSIADMSSVWVEVQLLAYQIPHLKPGDQAMITASTIAGKSWHGTINYIYPTVDKQTRALRVRVNVDNNGRELKPNMYVDVQLATSALPTKLLIPAEAVISLRDKNIVVLALGKGYFKSIEVELGDYTADFVEVISGLFVGDEVVISAQFLIDSESRKSSDLVRLSSIKKVSSATVKGVINQVDWEKHLVNISREAIEKWQRPAATMDFDIGRSIKPTQLVQGEQVLFTFEINDDNFVITHVEQLPSLLEGDVR